MLNSLRRREKYFDDIHQTECTFKYERKGLKYSKLINYGASYRNVRVLMAISYLIALGLIEGK